MGDGRTGQQRLQGKEKDMPRRLRFKEQGSYAIFGLCGPSALFTFYQVLFARIDIAQHQVSHSDVVFMGFSYLPMKKVLRNPNSSTVHCSIHLGTLLA